MPPSPFSFHFQLQLQLQPTSTTNFHGVAIISEDVRRSLNFIVCYSAILFLLTSVVHSFILINIFLVNYFLQWTVSAPRYHHVAIQVFCSEERTSQNYKKGTKGTSSELSKLGQSSQKIQIISPIPPPLFTWGGRWSAALYFELSAPKDCPEDYLKGYTKRDSKTKKEEEEENESKDKEACSNIWSFGKG